MLPAINSGGYEKLIEAFKNFPLIQRFQELQRHYISATDHDIEQMLSGRIPLFG